MARKTGQGVSTGLTRKREENEQKGEEEEKDEEGTEEEKDEEEEE